VGGLRACVIENEDKSGSGEKLVFTQKDIREVQLARALAAGIRMLAKRLGQRWTILRLS
jgi:uncharacterized 2Fe-2S/4Fe-4S cluster protein (DUF4445 family)